MKVHSDSFADGAVIPARYAFARIDQAAHVALSDNCNPHLAWEDFPAQTKSFAVVCHDYDVPSKADDVNQEGREIPASLPRVSFHHWILVDLPPSLTAIAEEASRRNSGARGLRAILEEVMLDVMYEIPSLTGVKECVVTREVVEHRARPELVLESKAAS